MYTIRNSSNTRPRHVETMQQWPDGPSNISHILIVEPCSGRSVLERVKSLYRSMKVKKVHWEKENEREELQRAAGMLCVCRLQGDLSAALHRWCCETSSVGTAALLCAMATTSLPANPSGAHLSDSPSLSTHPWLLFLFVSFSKLASVTL